MHPSIYNLVINSLQSHKKLTLLDSSITLTASDPEHQGWSRLSLTGALATQTLTKLLQAQHTTSNSANNEVTKPEQLSEPINTSAAGGPLSRRAMKRLKHTPTTQTPVQFFAALMNLYDPIKQWTTGRILTLLVPDPRRLRFQKPSAASLALKADDTLLIHVNTPVPLEPKATSKGAISKCAMKNRRHYENNWALDHPWPSLSSSALTMLTHSDQPQSPELFRPDHVINAAIHQHYGLQFDQSLSMTNPATATLSASMSAGGGSSSHVSASDLAALLPDVPIIVINRTPPSSLQLYHNMPRDPSTTDHYNAANSNRFAKGEIKWPVWDIIVPAAYGPIFWRALQYLDVKAMGIDDCEYINSCQGKLSFPGDYPDTAAGRQYWSDKLTELTAKNQLRPPRKRLSVRDVCDMIPQWFDIGEVFSYRRCRTVRRRKRKVAKKSIVKKQQQPILETMTAEVDLADVPAANIDTSSHASGQPTDAESPIAEADTVHSLYVIRSITEAKDHLPYTSDKTTSDLLNSATEERDSPGLPSYRRMVHVLVHFPGKGKATAGAKLLSPTGDDCRQWLLHRYAIHSQSLSCGLRGAHRLGNWHGVDMEQPMTDISTVSIRSTLPGSSADYVTGDNEASSEESSERHIMGFVTSGVPTKKGYSHKTVSIGLTDVHVLRESYRVFQRIVTALKQPMASEGSGHNYDILNADVKWRSARYTLVMVHSPHSQWLRPALVEYHVPATYTL